MKATKKVMDDLRAGAVFAASADSPSAAGAESTDANGQPRRKYVKDLIRAGRWVKAGQNLTFDVPVSRLRHWAKQFAAMRAAGIKIPVPAGHTTDPDRNRGEVVEMYVEGDTLYGVIELVGKDAIPMASRSEVSIFAEPIMLAGDGQRFEDVITHVAMVTDPVVNKQDGFVPVAASRGGTVRVPVLRFARESNMDWKELAAMLGLDITGLDDTTGPDAVKAAIASMAEMSKKAKADADTAAAATKVAQDQVAVLQASRGKPIEVDPDVLAIGDGATAAKADALVAAAKITPAVRDGLVKLFKGQPLALSRKAATAAGLAEPIAEAVLTILASNDPVALGEQTKAQALSRKVPGETAASNVTQAEIDARAARVSGGVARRK